MISSIACWYWLGWFSDGLCAGCNTESCPRGAPLLCRQISQNIASVKMPSSAVNDNHSTNLVSERAELLQDVNVARCMCFQILCR